MAASFTKPYVEAARDAAGSLEAFEALVPELERLASALFATDELRKVVRNPGIPRDRKRAILQEIAARAGLEGLALNLSRVLLANRRLVRLREVIAAIREQADRERHLAEATLATARPLPAAVEAEVSRALAARTGKSIRLKSIVDPGLLGGFVVRVGSEVYDASLAHRLQKAKNSLHAASGNVSK